MGNVYNTLTERGFVEQTTHEEEIIKLLEKEKVTFYIGFDPTADSLTVGHYMTLMAMSHMQRAGHRPVVLVGGGTGMVGDPTDRTEMRQLMSVEQVKNNVNNFKKQISRFIDFEDDNAIMVDNGDWLLDLKYVEFVREYGVHFSVNKMLTADAYKSRFEKGLSFFEFNYMLMQSYDYLELNRRFGCKLQMGGNDQWSNIIGGINLIRRCDNKSAYGLTFPLLTTADGKKMGKSQAGAVWLDERKTPPFDLFQYFRNVHDDDVIKFLKLLTFLPLDEINELAKLKDNEINKAKEILAFEITKIVHGEDEAKKALEGARALFSGGGAKGSAPTTNMKKSEFENGKGLIELLDDLKLVPSRGEARRLISQGGVKINEEKITDPHTIITLDLFENNKIMIQKGKKTFHEVVVD